MSSEQKEKKDVVKRKRSEAAEDKPADEISSKRAADLGDSDDQESFKRAKAQKQKTDSAGSYENDLSVSFKSAQDISLALNTTNNDLLVQGFMHLREHLKICNREPIDAESAEQKVLREQCRRVVYKWAEGAEDFRELEAAWERAYTFEVARLDSLIPNAISGLLKLFDAPTGMGYGNALVCMALDRFIKPIYRALNSSRSSACAAVLQLLYQIVVYARGEHADRLLRSFDWALKPLDDLPNMRSNVVGFSIRRLWIRFVLAFFSVEKCKTFNVLFKVRFLISNLFNSVEKDSYQELHTLLNSIYENIILNASVTRADKVRLLSIELMGNLAKASSSTAAVDLKSVGIEKAALFIPEHLAGDAKEIADKDSMSALIIRFFRGMMTYPGHGICFPQYGLYPPPREMAAEASAAKGDDGKGSVDSDVFAVTTMSKKSAFSGMHNLCNAQILRILLHAINPAGSKRMSDLAIDILRVSPELVAPFWQNCSLLLDPRLSPRYLGNTAFVLKVMSLALPIPENAELDPRYSSPPPLSTLIEHIYPLVLQRDLVGQGLQLRASPLVIYRNLLFVEVAMQKLDYARAWIRKEMHAAGGAKSVSGAKWHQLDQKLVAVLKQRVPEAKIVIAMQRVLQISFDETVKSADKSDEELKDMQCRHAVLGDSLMRVVGGYQRHFNELLLEHNFELGKLIADVKLSNIIAGSDGAARGSHNAMDAHMLLHLLRALETAPDSQTRWLSRAGGPKEHTYLGLVLTVFLFAVLPEVRCSARAACLSALRSTGLFDHDAGREAECWLDSMALLVSPQSLRNTRISSVTRTSLDSAHSLVEIFENSIALAAKQPNKYADRIHSVLSAETLPFSPLMPAVMQSAVLKVSAGSGPLAALMRESSPARVLGEIRTNIAFTYAAEVACTISERCGQQAAEALRKYMPRAATMVLEPRAAKLGSDSVERKHYAVVEAAFEKSLHGLLAYLELLDGSNGAGRMAVTEENVPAKIGGRLQTAFEDACVDFENGLQVFIDKMVGETQEHGDELSAYSLTIWLLSLAKGYDSEKRQMAFIACIRWITLQLRSAADDTASLWDNDLFVELAPEILQIDDLSFLLALFRHLLASQRTGLLGEPIVQQLLAHILLASKGSLSFCALASLLVKRAVQQGGEPEEFAFVFCLVSAHIDSLSAEMAETALEAYSGLLADAPNMSDMAEYDLAVLARKSSQVWLSKNKPVALRIWSPLVARIESKAAKQLASGGRNLAHCLALVRTIEPCMDANARIAMVQILAASGPKLESDSAAICLLSVAVFGLLDGVSNLPKDLLALKSLMANRIIRLWSESLLGGRNRALEQAALSVTRPEKQSNDLRSRIEAARESIIRPAEFAEAIDVAAVLSRLWNRSARSQSVYAKDAESRKILSQLLVSDAKLRKRACAWAESAVSKKGGQQLMLAWLHHALAEPYVEIGASGSVSWSSSTLAKRIRNMCLSLGGRLDVEKDVFADASSLFLIKAFVQDAQDSAIVSKRFSSCALSSSLGSNYMVAEIVRSRTLRQTGSSVELLDMIADVLSLAADTIPPLACASEAGSETWNVVDILCDSALNIALNARSGHGDNAFGELIAKCFDSLQAIVGCFCLEIDATNAYWPASEAPSLAGRIPASVFRLAAYATRAVQHISKGSNALPQPWFGLLRSVLRCRLFSHRMQGNMRDGLALLVGALWDIASPSLSCWSASLDDFFTLDELEALTGAYSGTRTPSDAVLLYVISMYEHVTRQSVRRAALAFGPTAAKMYLRERIGRAQYLIDRNENLVGEIGEDVVANALSCIEDSKMYRSLVEFPVYSQFESRDAQEWLFDRLSGRGTFTDSCEDNYDPCFILRWLWTLVSSAPQHLDYRQIIESNAVGMAIVALSSAHLKTRKLAYYVLDAFYLRFSGSTEIFRGGRQCLLLLDSLRNAIADRTESDFPLIPFTTTLFVATSLSVMLHPEHAVYMDLNRLLLKRPYLALGEVPMLRTALRTLSNSRRQRVHIIRLIAQSARAIDLSWLWFFKSNSVNIVMTLAADPLGDVATSRSALMLLFHLTSSKNPQSLVRHVSKNRFSLLVWVRQQAMLEINSLVGAASQANGEAVTGNYGPLVQGVKAALVNLTAFMRVIMRAIANYPLVVLKEKGLQFKSFWVVASSKQVNAPGQSSALDLIQLIVESVATTLGLLAENPSASRLVVGPAVTLLRTCLDTVYLLASMQRAAGSVAMCMPQSAQIAHGSIAILRNLEPYIDLEYLLSDKKAAGTMAVEKDPCSVVSIAQAQSFDCLFACSVFAANGTRDCESGYAALAYKAAIECMVSWCFESPWKTCVPADYLEIVCRGLAVGDARVSKSLALVYEEHVSE